MLGAAQPLTPFNHLTGRPPTLHQGYAAGAGPLPHLAWFYLLSDRTLDAMRTREDLFDEPQIALNLLDAAIELATDNFGSATGRLLEALEDVDQQTKTGFFVKIERFIRLAKKQGYGESLIRWFELTGITDQLTPTYAALKAFIRGERVLLDVNPEVGELAQIIYDRLMGQEKPVEGALRH